MRIVRGKAVDELTQDQLALKAREHARCLIDLGTGDGRFLYHYALKHQDTLCIGLDAVATGVRRISGRCLRKPAKGGAANALFVLASVECLPQELGRLADRITINYPWGSLLKALVVPDEQILGDICRLARPGAHLAILLNLSVFEDVAYRARLQLPALSLERVATELSSRYAAAGITLAEPTVIDHEAPHRTSWGQRLHLGSGRRAMAIKGVITGVTTAGAQD